MDKLPQRLVNVRVADRDAAMASAELAAATERECAALEGRGRVLVRPSGTEQLVRVMVEAPSDEETDAVCGRLVRSSRPSRRRDTDRVVTGSLALVLVLVGLWALVAPHGFYESSATYPPFVHHFRSTTSGPSPFG